MKPIVVTRRRGRLECDVQPVSDWDGLTKLAQFLEKYYGATVQDRIDGPDARRWILVIRGVQIELEHEDPWGNVIVAPESSSEGLLREIAADLEGRLAHLPSSS